MPIRRPRPIPYSSPIFYEFPDQWQNEQFNNKIEKCGIVAAPFCLPWQSGEPFCFQFLAGETGQDIADCTPLDSGTATGGGTNQLNDSGASFNTLGLGVGQIVINVTTGDTFAVTAVAATQLTLTGGGAFAAGNVYQILPFLVSTTSISQISYDTSDGKLCLTDFSGSITLVSGLDTSGQPGKWYRYNLNICEYTRGTGEVVFDDVDNDPTLTIQSPGQYEMFGNSFDFGIITFQATTADPFTGCLCLCDSEGFELVQEYGVAIGEDPPFYFTYDGGGLSRGVIEACLDLNDGCQTICIFNGEPCDAEGEQNPNPNMEEEGAGYTFGDTIAPNAGDTICMEATPNGSGFSIPIGCVVEGKQYTVQVTLDSYSAGGFRTTLTYTSGNVQTIGARNGNTTSPFFPIQPITATTYIYTFIAQESDSNAILGISAAGLPGVLNTMCFSELSIIGEENYPVGTFMCSECYDVKELTDCELQMTWTNEHDAFGHYYAQGFVQKMYAGGRLLNGYIQNIEHREQKGSDGYQRSFFSNGKKVETLQIDPVPDNVHQSIAVGLMHRNFKIGLTQYVRVGDYEPDFGSAEISRAEVEVAKVDQRYIVNSF